MPDGRHSSRFTIDRAKETIAGISLRDRQNRGLGHEIDILFACQLCCSS
jgi:hypothetical protein